MNLSNLWKELINPETTDAYSRLPEVEEFVKTSTEKAEVSFGTSGWRGELGVEFTYKNIQVVARALVEMYKNASPELFVHLGVSSFEQLQKEGVIIGHDNRMAGPDFARIIAGEFSAVGIKVFYGGEASTPEFSATIYQVNAACAVNITPSHNPANYSGLKFNPKDGGPAGTEITEKITQLSNEIMQKHTFADRGDVNWELIDLKKHYIEYLSKKGTLNLSQIREFANSGKLTLVTDHVHASTRGLSSFVLNNPGNHVELRMNDDLLFGQIAPEPSSSNMKGVREAVFEAQSLFKLGVIFDPDGDRIRFYDGEIEIDMNRFGAMAFHYLWKYRGFRGVCAKSVATSNFANAIAAGLGAKMEETAVGFKNFRPSLREGADPMAVIAFEESDGISGFNNTIEKDAQFGLLLSIEMIASTGKSLGLYLKELQEEYGYFFPERRGFEVDKSLVGAPLVARVKALSRKVKPGDLVNVGGVDKAISQVLTLDGVKIIFEDESWMLVRPSGTEPKVRIYTECRVESESQAMFEAAQALFDSI
jgi:phosphomannomutase